MPIHCDTHSVSDVRQALGSRVDRHLEVSCTNQVHHHGEWRLPRHADRVQLLAASVKWQLLLWPHLEALLVFQVFWPAGNMLLAQCRTFSGLHALLQHAFLSGFFLAWL